MKKFDNKEFGRSNVFPNSSKDQKEKFNPISPKIPLQEALGDLTSSICEICEAITLFV